MKSVFENLNNVLNDEYPFTEYSNDDINFIIKMAGEDYFEYFSISDYLDFAHTIKNEGIFYGLDECDALPDLSENETTVFDWFNENRSEIINCLEYATGENVYDNDEEENWRKLNILDFDIIIEFIEDDFNRRKDCLLYVAEHH